MSDKLGEAPLTQLQALKQIADIANHGVNHAAEALAQVSWIAECSIARVERHVHLGPHDECGRCGLDFRNTIHLRVGEN